MIKREFTPTLPLRDIVVFPAMIIPLFVGRDKSIKALNEVMKTNKKIILVTQKNAEIDDPNVENLYSYGCESKILQLLKLPDGTVKVLAEGVNRVKILECKNDSEYLASSVEIVKDKIESVEDTLAFSIAIVRKLEKLTNLNKKLSFELMSNLKDLKDPTKIADHISAQLNISIFEKQKLLEIIDLKNRLEKLMEHINNEINVIGVEKRIRGRVKNQMEKTQREYYLNEQLKAIQRELGEIEEGKDIQKLIEDMYATMDHANGVGLAAPQVNQGVRLFVIDSSLMLDENDEEKGIRRAFWCSCHPFATLKLDPEERIPLSDTLNSP